MATTRSVHEHELDEVLELYQMLNPGDPELERTEDLRVQWQKMVHDENLEIIVVEHDDKLVASCLLSITPNLSRNARPFGVIENVVTHEECRRNGFARRCLQTATEIAEEHDCYKIMLLTGSNSEWKHEFYESCGFDKDAKTSFVLDLR